MFKNFRLPNLHFKIASNNQKITYSAKRVVITDLPRFLPLLQEGIDFNPNLTNIQSQALSWGAEEDLKHLDFVPDLILVSDCIYYEASVEPLISTLKSVCQKSKHCRILISYEVRDYLESKKVIAKEFFRAVGSDFLIKPFATSECHEDFASDDIRVIELLPK